MSLAFVLGVLFVCLAAPIAAAERAIAVDVHAGAPFDASELRRALAVRLPLDGARVVLTVAPAGEGVVQITAGERVRDVDVTGLHGEAAARLVALAASDLVHDDFADELPPPPRIRSSAFTLGAFGAVSSWPQALAGGAVDVTFPAQRTLLAIEVGGATLVGAAISMNAITARLAAGLRPHEAVELRGGVTLAPIFVSGGAGSVGAGDRTVLVGGHAAIRLHFALQARVHAVVAAGADVFATRTEYRVGGMPVFVTPRFAPSLSIGFEVTP